MNYGDIVQLGQHRLMCGDATKREYVDKLLDGRKVDLILTDPPYGMKAQNKDGSIGGKHRGGGYPYSKDTLPLTRFCKQKNIRCYSATKTKILLKPTMKLRKIFARSKLFLAGSISLTSCPSMAAGSFGIS